MKWFRLALFIEEFILRNYHCVVLSEATLGRNIKLPHPIGIVIGAGCSIAHNVIIYQNITIGRKDSSVSDCPRILEGVIIYANSLVLGGVIMSERTTLGACSLLITDSEANSIYIGIPARRVK
jgi:serine O-acetyltransferase